MTRPFWGNPPTPWMNPKYQTPPKKKPAEPKKPGAGPGSSSPNLPNPIFPSPQSYLTFQGRGFANHTPRTINVLCGDEPPTVTGGYANWQTVARPLMRSLSVFQGYDPMQMTCSIRCGKWNASDPMSNTDGGWQIDADAADYVENHQIKWLEYYGGSGFSSGPSPVVYITAAGAKGLIPVSNKGKPLPWVVSGIQWGQAYRLPSGQNAGSRVYQEATLTLMEYLGFTAAPVRVNSEGGGYFTATPKLNTPLKIAGAPSAHSPPAFQETLAQRIVHDPLNSKLHLRNVRSKIKPGKRVHVPPHAL